MQPACDLHVILQAREAAARGDLAGAKRSGHVALGLNIAAVVFFVIILALIIGLVVTMRITGTQCDPRNYFCQ